VVAALTQEEAHHRVVDLAQEEAHHQAAEDSNNNGNIYVDFKSILKQSAGSLIGKNTIQ
jgi:hypothetical protein